MVLIRIGAPPMLLYSISLNNGGTLLYYHIDIAIIRAFSCKRNWPKKWPQNLPYIRKDIFVKNYNLKIDEYLFKSNITN